MTPFLARQRMTVVFQYGMFFASKKYEDARTTPADFFETEETVAILSVHLARNIVDVDVFFLHCFSVVFCLYLFFSIAGAGIQFDASQSIKL